MILLTSRSGDDLVLLPGPPVLLFCPRIHTPSPALMNALPPRYPQILDHILDPFCVVFLLEHLPLLTCDFSYSPNLLALTTILYTSQEFHTHQIPSSQTSSRVLVRNQQNHGWRCAASSGTKFRQQLLGKGRCGSGAVASAHAQCEADLRRTEVVLHRSVTTRVLENTY